jgi:hypothetical protein
MSEAILAAAVTGVIAVALVVHTFVRRSAPATDGTAVPVLRPADRKSDGSRERAALADPNVWRFVVLSDLTAAEELLDWAEEQGYQERELVVLGESTFLVRWRNCVGNESRGAT